jgi:hypothetical protein
VTGLTNAIANSYELGDAIIQFVPNHLLSMILGWFTMIERMFFVFDWGSSEISQIPIRTNREMRLLNHWVFVTTSFRGDGLPGKIDG